MHWKITALWRGKKVELRETQRAVTPFGGLVVFFEFLRQVGYREAVSKHLPFTTGGSVEWSSSSVRLFDLVVSTGLSRPGPVFV